MATLNEFRELFGLKKHKKFQDINADLEIQNALRDLYGNPDMVELYPGFICEGNGRCLDPGTGGPNNGETALWSAVFCDAITLVRSDRFYTVDWNVSSLTSWGMREVTSDPTVLKGSVFHRLFQRAFPGYFKHNAVHLWQPFITPAKNIIIAEQQDILTQLSLSGLQFDLSLASKLGGVVDPDDPRFKIDFDRITYEDIEGKIHRKMNHQASVQEVWRPPMTIEISSYHEIRNTILGTQRTVFKRPAILDKNIIPGKYLPDLMAGNSKHIDAGTDFLQSITSKDLEKTFFDYFVGVSKEIADREKRLFQKIKLSQAYFQQQRDQIQKLKVPDSILKRELGNLAELERLAIKARATNDQLSSNEQDRLSQFSQTYQLDVVNK